MLNEPCRQLIETHERAAGGLASQNHVVAAKRAVSARARQEFTESGTDGLAEIGPGLLQQLRLEHLPGWEGVPPPVTNFEGTDEQRRRNEAVRAGLLGALLVLLRDIFGNPFRPVAFDPAWRTEAAAGLARGIYEERAFERLPILADALQDAGCEHADILAHCREPGTHVRGCWVVDLVLGKE
jgi:hypothetical protein